MTRLVKARGYPTADFDDQLAYLSVEHARTLGHYRDAHEIFERGQRSEASTEELRQALVHYRALFAELLEAADNGAAPRKPAPDSNTDTRDTRNGAARDAAADNGALRRPAPDPDPEEHAHA